jgi:hypothetical protein
MAHLNGNFNTQKKTDWTSSASVITQVRKLTITQITLHKLTLTQITLKQANLTQITQTQLTLTQITIPHHTYYSTSSNDPQSLQNSHHPVPIPRHPYLHLQQIGY